MFAGESVDQKRRDGNKVSLTTDGHDLVILISTIGKKISSRPERCAARLVAAFQDVGRSPDERSGRVRGSDPRHPLRDQPITWSSSSRLIRLEVRSPHLYSTVIRAKRFVDFSPTSLRCLSRSSRDLIKGDDQCDGSSSRQSRRDTPKLTPRWARACTIAGPLVAAPAFLDSKRRATSRWTVGLKVKGATQ